MKFSKWHFAVRCILAGLLGALLALAGVVLWTPYGAAIYTVLLVMGAVDGLHEVCALRRAFKAGQRDMAEFVVRKGWRV